MPQMMESASMAQDGPVSDGWMIQALHELVEQGHVNAKKAGTVEEQICGSPPGASGEAKEAESSTVRTLLGKIRVSLVVTGSSLDSVLEAVR